jgi:hypothetical protein
MTGGNSSAGEAIVGIACRFPGAAAWGVLQGRWRTGRKLRQAGRGFTGLSGVVSSYLSFDYPSARNLVNSAPHVEMTPSISSPIS